MVIEKSSNSIVGSTAFGNYSPADQRIEIGWTWLGKVHHGSGNNRQMKLLMVRYCAEVLKIKRIELKTDVMNLPARNDLLSNNRKNTLSNFSFWQTLVFRLPSLPSADMISAKSRYYFDAISPTKATRMYVGSTYPLHALANRSFYTLHFYP